MCSDKNMNFVSMCANGKLLLDDIDDFIDEWHESDSDEEIYEYLGMSQQEYRLWVHDPDILSFIVTARSQQRSIDDVLADIQDLPMAARADSPAKAKSLMKRLKEYGV